MNYLLDKAKGKLGSDRKVSKHLGITETRLSSIRHGRIKLTPYQAGQLAELIGEPWADHVLPVMMEKARNPAEKDYWLGKLLLLRQILGPTAKHAGTLAIMATTALSLHSGQIAKSYIKNEVNSLYIM